MLKKYLQYDTLWLQKEYIYIHTKKGDVIMHFLEFKRRFSLLNEEEKEFIYKLKLKDAIDFLRTIY